LIVVKTKKQSEILSKIGYNPSKRIQIVPKYGQNKFYFKNVKDNFLDLLESTVTLIITPIVIILQSLLCLLSLNYWTLIYTKKELSNESNIVKAKFVNPKDKEIKFHFDNPEDIF
jgi:hypothetical protein